MSEGIDYGYDPGSGSGTETVGGPTGEHYPRSGYERVGDVNMSSSLVGYSFWTTVELTFEFDLPEYIVSYVAVMPSRYLVEY